MNEVKGPWPCPHCRLLPMQVANMKAQLDTLLSQNICLTQIVSQQQTALSSLQKIETKFTALVCKLFPDDDTSDDEDDEPDDVTPEGTLLIGDSLIRDVTAKDRKLTVDCNRGATINIIKKKLRSINPKKKKYESIYIVVGTNDASSKRPVNKIITDYENLIAVAKEITTNVVVSTIPPRTDEEAVNMKIGNINQLLVPVTNSVGTKLVNNDVNFRYRDDTIDSSLLLLDGLHLSQTGVSKLLKNLGLENAAHSSLKTGPSSRWQPNNPTPSAIKSPPLAQTMSYSRDSQIPPKKTSDSFLDHPIHFRGTQSPFSNFFEFELRIWNMNFRSAEQAFQYHKCVQMGANSAAAEVMKATTPLMAKRIGDHVTTSPRWHDLKQGVLYEILKTKARQCPAFTNALRDSNDRLLIENTFDPYWGKGSDGKGLNMLGRILMTIRAELSSTAPHPTHFTPRPSIPPHRNNNGIAIPRSRDQQPRCFNCGEMSHTLDSCRHRHPLQCYGCFGKGHKQKFCPVANRNQAH